MQNSSTLTKKEGKEKSFLIFIILVFIFSIPFWYLGAGGAKLTKIIPINLPISALMFVCPFSAALILTYRDTKFDGIKKLISSAFDYKRVKRKIWYLPAILLMPVFVTLSYAAMRLMGQFLPTLQITLQLIVIVVILFLAFFIAALCEELGWSGYAIDRVQNRWGALQASLILGIVWAVWHIIPYFEDGDSLSWIFWMCIFTVAARVIITWLYNNSGKSVSETILFHTMINVSTFLFPIYGSFYNPEITGIITMAAAVIIVILWGPKTLDKFIFANVVQSRV